MTLLLCFGINPIVPVTPASARHAAAPSLPAGLILPTRAFAPAVMRGVKINPQNPFEFNFIIDTGEQELAEDVLESESSRLIKYFLAALTVPEEDLWVNLTPGEEDRVVAGRFGSTAMGRDMLAQDFLLKQFASSLMYPDGEIGQRFWERVHQRAHQQLGTTDIPLNSLNKVWIVPAQAKVYANEDGAYVIGARLKVMLEEDYARASDLIPAPAGQATEENVTHELIREILIPEIEREVNEGEHFARLRQIYHSLVLATWYKRTLRNSILTRQYADQNKVRGVDDVGDRETQQIYEKYMHAVRKGVYNYIREDYDPVTRATVPRKYMSGGLVFAMPDIDEATLSEMVGYADSAKPGAWKNVMTRLQTAASGDAAMLSWRGPPGGHGTEGLPITQHADLTLSPAEIDVLAAARGTVRPLSLEDQRVLRERLIERDNLFRSSEAMDYYEDSRFNRRDYSRRGTRAVVFSQLGSLFFFDREYYLGLPEDVRKDVGSNAIVLDNLNDLEMYDRDYAPYTNAVLAMMLEQSDWSGRQVIDVGAGEGILGIVAFKLGAKFVEAFDVDVDKLQTAKNLFRINGMETGNDYRVHAGDLRNQEYLDDRIDQLRNRIESSEGSPRVAVLTNVGFWPIARFKKRERQYDISNQKALEIAEQIPGTDMIIAGGYNIHNIPRYESGMKRDLKKLTELGFRVLPRPINYHQTDLMVALTAVRSDAAILGGGKLQEWLRRMRPDEARKRNWAASWGRARDLASVEVQDLMASFRTDPGLVTVSWDGDLPSGQSAARFELEDRVWVREDAYLRQASGPGPLVLVRLGHLFLFDRSFYMDLDDAVKAALGTNALIIPRLNESQLESPLFRIYNSSTALAQIAQGDFRGHHVIDVGSGDGLQALIAHKLGAVHSELIERDAFGLMRATHVLTLNGLEPDEDFTAHNGDITEEGFVRQTAEAMLRNMAKQGAESLTVVANIGQWDDYYGEVNNRTVLGMTRFLPPVDRLILGGYDVSDVERNHDVTRPDVEALQAGSYAVESMTLRYAGKPLTVALVAKPTDQAQMSRLEKIFEEALDLDAAKLERSQVDINGQTVRVTQYINAQFEEVPYFTVGDYMVVNRHSLDQLPQPERSTILAAPGVIVLDQREFTDAFAYERWEGYGGFTMAVMAAMVAFREQIEGRTFVDFGAGTGVLSILADRLGAKQVIAIEGRDDVQDVLTDNLRENGLEDVLRHRAMIESVEALDVGEQPVFAMNLPYFGVQTGSGEPSGAFQKAFALVPTPSVAFLSGGSFGRGAIDDYVIRALRDKGAVDVLESTVMKERVSDIELSASNVLTAVFRPDILASADNAIFSRNSRRRLFQRATGLIDRYVDRIPPQFGVDPSLSTSLIDNNPLFAEFLRGLDLKIQVSPELVRNGFWEYELPLTNQEAHRIMDLLTYPDRLVNNRMPDGWKLVFYKHEPLLLVMEGLSWASLSEDTQRFIFESYAGELVRKGLSEEGMRILEQGLRRLRWSRGISLIPVEAERVSHADRLVLSQLSKWADDVSEYPLIVADTLFDKTSISGVTSPLVTAWGAYDSRALESEIFRSGINPRAGELIYVLGAGNAADAILAMERTGGDLRVVATDIDRYMVANARMNVGMSPYADKIEIHEADLFDFPRAPGEKSDRIYFNVPIDSLVALRKKDPRVGDPGMRLLQRLLREAPEHLKPGGTLELDYIIRPSFLWHVYKSGWEVRWIDGEELFDTYVDNANQQAWKYLRFTLTRQGAERRAEFEEVIADLDKLRKMEARLLASMLQEGAKGARKLSQKDRERFRRDAWDIVLKWNQRRGMTASALSAAGNGVWWLAKSSMRFNPPFKAVNRFDDPAFSLLPNAHAVFARIEDQAILTTDPPRETEPWEEGALVRLIHDGLEGVITGRPFVQDPQLGRVPGYVIELKGLPWTQSEKATRIVSQDRAHRFFELLEPKRPDDGEKTINAALKENSAEIRGQAAAAVAKTIGVPAGKLRDHLKRYRGLISKYEIKYTPREDQAQLAANHRALGLQAAVSEIVRTAREERKNVYAPAIAAQVLAGYALVPGHLLPKADRHNGTVLSSELSKLLVSSPVLLERLSLLEIQEAVDAEADRLFARKRGVTYPARVDYRIIGELFRSRRGAMTRKDAAARIGIGQATVKKIEEWGVLEGEARYTAGATANLETLLKFLNFYEIQVEQLLGRESRQTVFAPYTTEFIGPNIKSHRDRQGLTIDDMAARMGMNRANYDRLEAGGYNPSFDVLVRVAGALGVSLEALLRPNLVLAHQPRRVPDEEQSGLVRKRYSQEGMRLRLRELRNRRGLSVQQVADALGRAAPYVGQMENARDKTYFIERVKRMADFYGVSLFYLVTGLRTQTEGLTSGGAEINGEWLRQNLRAVREHRGLRRRDVDRLAGIPTDVVQRVEREGEPLFDYFVKISAALQMPMDVLLGAPDQVQAYLRREEQRAVASSETGSGDVMLQADLAMFAEDFGHRQVWEALNTFLDEAKAGEDINARETAGRILSRFAFTAGDLVPEADRQNGSVLSAGLRDRTVGRDVTMRTVANWMANQLDEEANKMFARRRLPRYPAKVNYQSIGQFLFDRRGKTSAAEVAKAVGVSVGTVARFEQWRELTGTERYTAGRNTSLATLLKLLNHYEVFIDELFGLDRPARPFYPYTTDFVGDNIRNYRGLRDMTLEDLGEKVRTSRSHVDKWESGEKNVSLHYLLRIARSLQTSLDGLLRENVVLSHTLRQVEDEEQWVALHDRFDASDVRDRLRKLRRLRGLSTYQLAERLGVSQAYVTGLENSNHEDVTIERLRVFADFYQVSLFYLATGLKVKEFRTEVYENSVDMDRLRENVKLAREHRGWNGHELERRGEFSRGYVSTMEGGAGPLFGKFVRLAEVLEVPMDVLLGRPEDVRQYLRQEERYPQLGERLRIHMEAQQLSLQDIAEDTGIAVHAVRRILSGKVREALVRDLVSLAAYLNVRFDQLFAGLSQAGTLFGEEFVPISLKEGFEQRLGQRLRQWMEDSQLSQWAMGDMVGLSQDRISQILNGADNLRLFEVQVLLRFAGLELSGWIVAESTSSAGVAPLAADQAQLTEAPGGIDFRADTVPLEIDAGAAGPAVLEGLDPQTIQIDGLVPVILHISPVTSIPLLLGLNDRESVPLAELPADAPDPAADPRSRMIAALTSG